MPKKKRFTLQTVLWCIIPGSWTKAELYWRRRHTRFVFLGLLFSSTLSFIAGSRICIFIFSLLVQLLLMLQRSTGCFYSPILSGSFLWIWATVLTSCSTWRALLQPLPSNTWSFFLKLRNNTAIIAGHALVHLYCLYIFVLSLSYCTIGLLWFDITDFTSHAENLTGIYTFSYESFIKAPCASKHLKSYKSRAC